MRWSAFGRRGLDRFVHVMAIAAFTLNFAFVIVAGYFVGKFVKVVEIFQENLKILKGVVMEYEEARDAYRERCTSATLKNLDSRQSGGEHADKTVD